MDTGYDFFNVLLCTLPESRMKHIIKHFSLLKKVKVGQRLPPLPLQIGNTNTSYPKLDMISYLEVHSTTPKHFTVYQVVSCCLPENVREYFSCPADHIQYRISNHR